VQLMPPQVSPRADDVPAAPAETRWTAARVFASLPHWAERERWLLWPLVAIAYAWGFNGQWRHTPDSALYLTVGRNLARGHGFVHTSPGLEVFGSPGLPWLAALCFRLFGEESHLAIHFVMLAIALATLAMAYRLFTLHLGRGVAVLLTGMLAVTALFYRYAFLILTDMPFLLGLLTALVGFEQLERLRRPVGAGADGRPVATGRATTAVAWAMIVGGVLWMAMFRTVVMVFLAGVLLAAVLAALRARRWSLALAPLGVTALGVVAVRMLDPTTPVSGLLHDEVLLRRIVTDEPVAWVHRLLTQNLPELFAADAAEAMLGIAMHPIPAALVGLTGLGMGVALFVRRPLWGCVVAAFVVQWLTFLVDPRYLLAIMPLLVMGWWFAAAGLYERLPRPWNGRLAMLLLAIWLTPNLIACARFVAEQHGRMRWGDRVWVQQVTHGTLAESLRQQTPPDAIVLTSARFHSELAYLGDRAVWTLREARLHLHEHPDRPLFLVGPADPELRRWLQSVGLRPGVALSAIVPPGQVHPWTVQLIRTIDSD
jgi:4-amino-4-deoxy-L-arabinose transferase-like glycosyltransferase